MSGAITATMPPIRRIPALIMSGLLALTTGCATVPPTTPLAEVHTVGVELFSTPYFSPRVPVERDPEYHVGRNAGGGALAGMAVGVECGIFFFICSPVGAIVGAAGGAIYGATAGAVTSLPGDEAEAFNIASANFFQRRDLGNDLELAAKHQVVAHDKTLTSNDPDAVVSLHLTELEWIIGAGNTVRLRGEITARVHWAGGILVRDYSHATSKFKVKDWIADNGSMMDTELELFMDVLMLEIVEDLQGATGDEAV